MPIQDEQWGYIRVDRDARLRNDVDPKSLEAFNNGTKLNTKWKKFLKLFHLILIIHQNYH